MAASRGVEEFASHSVSCFRDLPFTTFINFDAAAAETVNETQNCKTIKGGRIDFDHEGREFSVPKCFPQVLTGSVASFDRFVFRLNYLQSRKLP